MMTNIEVFSDRFVTEKNKNGRGIIDIDTPEGIEIFGGQEAVDEYKAMQVDRVEALKTRVETLERN